MFGHHLEVGVVGHFVVAGIGFVDVGDDHTFGQKQQEQNEQESSFNTVNCQPAVSQPRTGEEVVS